MDAFYYYIMILISFSGRWGLSHYSNYLHGFIFRKICDEAEFEFRPWRESCGIDGITSLRLYCNRPSSSENSLDKWISYCHFHCEFHFKAIGMFLPICLFINIHILTEILYSNLLSYPRLFHLYIFNLGNWICDICLCCLQGLFSGTLILLTTKGKNSRILVFSEELFFIYVLPPIIFNAGYVLVVKSIRYKVHLLHFLASFVALVPFFLAAAVGSWYSYFQ